MNSKVFHVQWDIHEPFPEEEGNKHVVVIGRLTQFTPYNLRCTLSCVKSLCKDKHDIAIDTSLIDPSTCPVIGSLVKVFGELIREEESTVLRAKMIICLDFLNAALYHKALKLRNSLKRTGTPDDPQVGVHSLTDVKHSVLEEK